MILQEFTSPAIIAHTGRHDGELFDGGGPDKLADSKSTADIIRNVDTDEISVKATSFIVISLVIAQQELERVLLHVRDFYPASEYPLLKFW